MQSCTTKDTAPSETPGIRRVAVILPPSPATPHPLQTAASEDGPDLHLRILATTDLHLNVLGFDYVANRPRGRGGLIRLAPLIDRARAESGNCLLLDNGDFLEGSPMADYALSRADGPHPMVAAMNALGYDAATLGNHEFTHGLAALQAAMADAQFPFVSANVHTVTTGAPLVAPFVVLDRVLTDQHGQSHRLRLGVTGALPPQTGQWDGQQIGGQLSFAPMVDAIAAARDAMKTVGADLVIVLAHCGPGEGHPDPQAENAGLALAALDGVDAVIMGHLHGLFPDPALAATAPGLDAARGLLHGKPAVMPGQSGSHLGVIDLCLARGQSGWHVRSGQAALWPAAEAGGAGGARPPTGQSARRLARGIGPIHRATQAWADRVIARLDRPLHSLFALVSDVPAVQIVHQAKIAHVRQALAATEWAGLPVLAATAPFRAGGRGGPDHFTDIPAGAFRLRHAFDLYPHPNRLMALLLTGDDLLHWLNHAARLFHQITPDQPDQPLLRADLPPFHFDTIGGLTYQIDLAAPEGARIARLCHAGRPIDPAARFVLATNSHRGHAAALGFLRAGCGQIILADGPPVRDLLTRHLTSPDRPPLPEGPGWTFAPHPGASVTFDTGPAAAQRLGDVPHLRLDPLGTTVDGFLRLRLWL